MATHSSVLAWRVSWTLQGGEGAGAAVSGVTESDTTGHLTHTHTHTHTQLTDNVMSVSGVQYDSILL